MHKLELSKRMKHNWKVVPYDRPVGKLVEMTVDVAWPSSLWVLGWRSWVL